MENSYNGWTNYETWAINLWMDESQDYWQDLIADIIEEEGTDNINDLTYRISEAIKQQHEDDAPQASGVFADLLSASLQRVNWYEIAESIVEPAIEEYKLENEEA
jgi:hypothetical protein